MDRRSALPVPAAVAAACVCLLVSLPAWTPLAGLASLTVEAGLPAVWPGPWVGAALARSLATGAIAAVVSLLVGIPAGLLLARRLGRRGGGLLAGLVCLPLAVPPFVAAYAWLTLVQRGPLAALRPVVLGPLQGGMEAGGLFAGVVLGAGLWPIVALLVAAAARAVDPAALDAARVHLTERATRRMRVRAILPAAGAGAATVLVLAAANGTVPGLLGTPSYAAEGLARLMAESDPAAALGAGGPVVGLALVALVVLHVRPPRVLAGGRAPAELEARPRAMEGAGLALGLGIGLVLPAVHMALEAGGLEAFRRAADLGGRALADSAAVSLVAAACAVACGSALAWWVRGLPAILRPLVDAICLVPFVLPAHATGAGVVRALSWTWVPRPLYDGPFRLVLGVTSVLLFPAYLACRASFATIPREALDAASASGLSPRSVWARIVLPWRLRTLLAIGLALAVLGLGEVGVAVVREPPGFPTVQVYLWNQMHYGKDPAVMALALITVGLAGTGTVAAASAALGANRRKK